ncbi:MAG: glycosyltransferase [Pseudomonadota bacterium]|nr:glycosyltransferase [Pseudomonadota bacterium]MDP1903380.1 glycosyltransferase [Pseudomonadota bacterium]MDP2352350.1 glycosyltransferase [Pseudomonadota bacterium]
MTACFDEFRKHDIEATGLPIPSGPLGRLRMLREAARHDVVLIQKKTSFRTLELKLLRRANPRLVFDMDDAVMFHELEHHQPLTGKNMIKFLRTIDHCAAVVAGNRFLAAFAEANCPHVTVLPTPVDTRLYRLKDYQAPSDTVTVGWLGVSGNLHYLRRLAPVFQELAREFPQFRLKIVSNDFIDIPGVPIIKERWSLEGEVESLRSFDIGIMPLDDSLWARGKCGYKILQYFGVGVPAVASPVGINAEFIENGVTGILAANNGQWAESLRSLIVNADARRRLGLAGNAELCGKYSLNKYAAGYAIMLHECMAMNLE